MMGLREAVARALWAADDAKDRERANYMPEWKHTEMPYEDWADEWLEQADVALAALGLDDWDEAVERAAKAMLTCSPRTYERAAETALAAALQCWPTDSFRFTLSAARQMTGLPLRARESDDSVEGSG